MPGVKHLDKKNNSVSFFFKADNNVLTKKIAALTVTDVAIEEPTLEEIFMHYYE